MSKAILWVKSTKKWPAFRCREVVKRKPGHILDGSLERRLIQAYFHVMGCADKAHHTLSLIMSVLCTLHFPVRHKFQVSNPCERQALLLAYFKAVSTPRMLSAEHFHCWTVCAVQS